MIHGRRRLAKQHVGAAIIFARIVGESLCKSVGKPGSRLPVHYHSRSPRRFRSGYQTDDIVEIRATVRVYRQDVPHVGVKAGHRLTRTRTGAAQDRVVRVRAWPWPLHLLLVPRRAF